MTLTQFLDQLSPVEVRLYAHSRGKSVTSKQIAAKTGMHPGTVSKISKMTSWTSVDVRRVDAFMQACGVTMDNRGEVRRELKRQARLKRPFGYVRRTMRRNPGRTVNFWLELIRLYVAKQRT